MSISTYFILSLSGIAAAFFLSLWNAKKGRSSFRPEQVVFIFIYTIVGTLFGAKIFQLVGYFIQNGSKILPFTFENIKEIPKGIGVFYGGVIGGGISIFFFSKKERIEYLAVTDFLVPSVLLFHAFGRIGCFSVGCCYGKECTWGIPFSESVFAPNLIPLFPVQLFEAGIDLLMLFLFFCMFRKEKKRGILTFTYLLSYSSARFVLEFFRGDHSFFLFSLSAAQWISIILVIISGFFLVVKTLAKPRSLSS